MRFVYVNDSHLRISRPACRIDKDFYHLQFEKFKEIFQIAKRLNGTVIHGGDMMHSHLAHASLLVDVIKILKEHSRIRVNPGNHDFFGANIITLRRSGLGILSEAGIVQLLSSGDFTKSVIFRAAPYQMEYPESFYWFDKKENGKFYVVAAHDMLVTRPVPFPHKNITKLKTNADLVLCSHWHSQFIKKVGKTLFVNSGPLDAQTTVERHIKPAVAIIDIGKTVEARFEFLKTTGYEEVEVIEEDEKAIGLADEFIAELKQSDLAEGTDIQQAILLVGVQSGYDPKIVQKTLDRVKELQSCA